MHGSIFV